MLPLCTRRTTLSTNLSPVLMGRLFNFWTRRVGVEPCHALPRSQK